MLARALPSCGGRSALGRHGAPAGCQRVHVLVHAQPQFTSAQAAAAASRPDGADEARKAGAVPIAPRPALPCDKPLPLANVMEVQRLLYLLEAPEYVMRAFREHGINGQDLLVLREDDLDDPRFKFPRHVVRKVMRISQAWKVFQSITGSVTKGAITMEQYVAHYSYGRSPDVVTQLQAAYRVVDANSNGSLTFEEFLVGFSLLDAAVADTRRPAFTAGAMHPGMPPSTGQTGVNWFQL